MLVASQSAEQLACQRRLRSQSLDRHGKLRRPSPSEPLNTTLDRFVNGRWVVRVLNHDAPHERQPGVLQQDVPAAIGGVPAGLRMMRPVDLDGESLAVHDDEDVPCSVELRWRPDEFRRRSRGHLVRAVRRFG